MTAENRTNTPRTGYRGRLAGAMLRMAIRGLRTHIGEGHKKRGGPRGERVLSEGLAGGLRRDRWKR